MIVADHAHTIVTAHVEEFTVATDVLFELYVTAHGELVVYVFVKLQSVVSFVTDEDAKLDVGKTAGALTVKVKLSALLAPSLSVAVTLMLKVPVWVGVPLRTPVVVLNDNPVGSAPVRV